MERGRRNIRPTLLVRSDDILRAGGHLKAFEEPLREARVPKKVRALRDIEAKALELGA